MGIDEAKDNLRSEFIDWNFESLELVCLWYDEREDSKIMLCIKAYRIYRCSEC